ncbi:MAG: NBR1-Ig-like domain-containing protein [Candidatus Promineifilaceae bacterium]
MKLVDNDNWPSISSYNAFVSGRSADSRQPDSAFYRTRGIELALPELAPGDIVDVTIELDVPGSPGVYSQNWQLFNDHGIAFGERLTVEVSAVHPGTINIGFNNGVLNIFADGYNQINGAIIGRNHTTSYYYFDPDLLSSPTQLDELKDSRLADIERLVKRQPSDGIGGQINIEGSGPLLVNGRICLRDLVQIKLISPEPYDHLDTETTGRMEYLQQFLERLEQLEREKDDPLPLVTQEAPGEYSGDLVLNGSIDDSVTIQGDGKRVEINGNISNPVGIKSILNLGMGGELLINGNISLKDAVEVDFIDQGEFGRAGITAEPQLLTMDILIDRIDALEKRLVREMAV